MNKQIRIPLPAQLHDGGVKCAGEERYAHESHMLFCFEAYLWNTSDSSRINTLCVVINRQSYPDD